MVDWLGMLRVWEKLNSSVRSDLILYEYVSRVEMRESSLTYESVWENIHIISRPIE